MLHITLLLITNFVIVVAGFCLYSCCLGSCNCHCYQILAAITVASYKYPKDDDVQIHVSSCYHISINIKLASWIVRVLVSGHVQALCNMYSCVLQLSSHLVGYLCTGKIVENQYLKHREKLSSGMLASVKQLKSSARGCNLGLVHV